MANNSPNKWETSVGVANARDGIILICNANEESC